MQHRATLRYTEALVKRAVGAYWRRAIGLGTLLCVPVVCGLLLWSMLDGERTWSDGLLAGVTVVALSMPILVYWVHYRNSMAKFRDMREPVATLIAEDESFALSSDIGSSTLRWDSIRELWGFDGFWLMLFSKAHFATIPLDNVPAEMRAFILDKVRSSGGKVSGRM